MDNTVFELVAGRHVLIAEADGTINTTGDTLLLYDTIAQECLTVPNVPEARAFFDLQGQPKEICETLGPSEDTATADRGINWTHAMTLLLISLVQQHKDTGLRVEKLWAVICDGMKLKGYPVTSKQCENKWKNLRKRYLQVKDGMKKTGTGRQTFTYFENFEEIFGKKHSIEPLSVSSNLNVLPNLSQPTNDEPPLQVCSTQSMSPMSSKRSRSNSVSPSTPKRRRVQEDWIKNYVTEKKELMVQKMKEHDESRKAELLLKERAVKALEGLQQSIDKILDKF